MHYSGYSEEGDHKRREELTPSQRTAANVREATKAVVGCLSTDFVDPITGAKVQEWYARRRNLQDHGHAAHTWGGELVGDFASGAALFTFREYFPKEMDWLSQAISVPLAPVYDVIARKVVKHSDDPKVYERRVAEWKDYQNHNIANTLCFSVAGIGGNVATQKWILRNPSPMDHILIGKLVGAGLTATLLIGSHAALPEFMKDLDHVFAKHVFEPVTRYVERQLGVEERSPETRGVEAKFISNPRHDKGKHD